MTRQGASARRGAGAEAVEPVGRPPEPHPVATAFDNPLATYYLLVGAIAVLLGFGLIMVFSASSVWSLDTNGSLFKVGLQQALYAVMGVPVAVFVSRFPVRTWYKVGPAALVASLFLQALVLLPGLGREINGNRNWLVLGPLTIQPSEFGKLALIVFAASVLAGKRRLLGDWKHAVMPVVFPAAFLLLALVMAGGDLGTTIILVAILFCLLWTSGVPTKLFGIGAGIGVAGILLLAVTSANRMARIGSWLNCKDALDQGCWQSMHGVYALADGGIWGQGLGASREKWGWLPERQNDYIFAVIGEELGIFGTFTVLLLICAIAYACYRVILQSDDMFVRIATSGVLGWFVVQSLMNIGTVVGLLPVIGVPLPLVSAGGSALLTTLLGLGMVVSFARNEPACRRALRDRPAVFSRSLSVLSPLRKRSR